MLLQQIVTGYSPRLKTTALLPEFPSVTDLRLTDDVTDEKVVNIHTSNTSSTMCMDCIRLALPLVRTL